MSEELKPCRKCGELDFDMWNGKGTQADLECNECGQGEFIQVSDLFSDAERFSNEFEFNQFTLSYSELVVSRCKAELVKQWNTRAKPTFTKEDVEKIAKAYYERLPGTYEAKVPTTTVSPAFVKKQIPITWEELDEDKHGRFEKNFMLCRMSLALNAVGKIEE